MSGRKGCSASRIAATKARLSACTPVANRCTSSAYVTHSGSDWEVAALAAVEEVGEMPNLGTGHFDETTLIRLLVRLGAEPHSPHRMTVELIVQAQQL